MAEWAAVFLQVKSLVQFSRLYHGSHDDPYFMSDTVEAQWTHSDSGEGAWQRLCWYISAVSAD